MNLKDMLEAKAKEVLSDETKKEITEAFEATVKESTDQRLKLELENAVNKIDDEHSELLKTLLENVDVDHVKKLNMVLEKIDVDHSKKLEELTALYEQKTQEDAVELRDMLVEKISTYLDLYIEKAIPKQQIAEAVKNMRVRKMLDGIKEIVGIDEEFVTENVKEALLDGKQIIDSTKGQLNKTLKENIKLNTELTQFKSKMLIEQKTKDLSENKKKFVTKMLSGKPTDEIEKNFSYVIEMFEREEEDAAEKLVTEATDKAVSSDLKVPVITEKQQITPELQKPESTVAGYLKELGSVLS
jgi:hypothetical protein